VVERAGRDLNAAPLLAAADLVAGYGAQDEILKGVSIEAAAGELVALIGPNGAGKSTLLKAIAGLVRPRSGVIRLKGEPLAGLAPREVSRRGVAFVPQEGNVFPSLTIRENLEIGGWLDRAALRRGIARVYQRFPELARRPGLPARALSGGQRQMLAMGMALMVAPVLLLLDEPSAGLSPIAADGLFDAIRAIRDDGVGIVMVEQNAAAALEVADRAYLLVDGENRRSGRAADIAADPEIRRLFLGG